MGPHRLLKRIYPFLELNDDNDDDEGDDAEDDKVLFPVNKCWYIHVRQIQLYLNLTRGQSNLTKSASRGAHSPVRGHPRGSKFVPLNSWGRVSY